MWQNFEHVFKRGCLLLQLLVFVLIGRIDLCHYRIDPGLISRWSFRKNLHDLVTFGIKNYLEKMNKGIGFIVVEFLKVRQIFPDHKSAPIDRLIHNIQPKPMIGINKVSEGFIIAAQNVIDQPVPVITAATSECFPFRIAFTILSALLKYGVPPSSE